MAVNIDWRLAQPTDIAGNALQGYQAGRAARRETDTQNALQTYANGGGTGALIAADPRTGLAFRQADQQAAREQRTEDQATTARHQAGTVQVLTAARRLPVEQRAAYIADAIRQRTDVWSPQDQATAIAALSNPQADFSDARMDAGITASGGDPEAGAYNLAPNTVRVSHGHVAAVGQPEPIIRGNMWTQPTLPRVGDPIGGATEGPGGAGAAPGLSAAPTTAQPQNATPAPSAGGLAHVIATPQDDALLRQFIAGESGHGPGEDAAIASSLINQAAGHGQTISEFIAANPRYSAALHSNTAPVRNTRPGTPQWDRYGQVVQSLASGQTPLSPYTNFEGASFPTRDFEHNPTTIGGTRFTTNPLPGGRSATVALSQPGPEPQGAANQTAPDTGDAGLPPGYHRLPAAPSDRVTYRPATIDDVRPYGYTSVPRGTQVGSDGQLHVPQGSVDADVSLSNSAVHNMALRYLAGDDHALGTLGSGRQASANRAAVQNEIASIQDSTGRTGVDAFVLAAGQRASSAALRDATVQQSRIARTEETFLSNATVAQNLANTGGASRAWPVFNGWIQGGRRATGDPQIRAFDAANTTIANEYGNALGGSGNQTTDSAREHALSLLSTADTPDQYNRVVATLRQDVANRRQAIDDNVTGITGAMRRNGMAGTTRQPAARPAASPPQTSPRIAASVGASGNQRGATPPGTVAAGVPDRQGNFPRPQAAPAPAASSRPAPPRQGAIVRGYRYTGGDPANPRSWQRAQ